MNQQCLSDSDTESSLTVSRSCKWVDHKWRRVSKGLFHELSNFIAQVEFQDFQQFSAPDLNKYLADKYQLKGLREGAEIIARSFENDEKVVVFSDFDCDGTTSAAQMVKLAQYVDKERNLCFCCVP